MLIVRTELLLQIIDGSCVISKRCKHFYKFKNALNEGAIEFILIVFFVTRQIYSKFERKL